MQRKSTAANLELSIIDDVIDNVADDLKDEQDENLMLRYRDGDAAAFEVLYSRHKTALFRYFNRQCSQTAIAEELFQESWMSIIKSRKNYVTSAKFKTYMYTIAHNKLIDYYRRNKIRYADFGDSDESKPGIDELPAPTQEQPEQIINAQQKRIQLLAAIKLLPETQRDVFLLREESGLSLSEIAKITGVNSETAKSRLRYAVNSLKKTVQAGDL